MSRALPIKDFPGYYITDTGDVYSRKTPNNNPECRIKKLKLGTIGRGYLKVDIFKNAQSYTKLVHRLVAETFISNPENKPQVNHKNGDKTDNRIENLEWVTNQENQIHSFKKLNRKSGMFNKYGSAHPKSKSIIQSKDGIIIAKFGSMREAERQTKICHAIISACCLGKLKSAGGYQWQYAE